VLGPSVAAIAGPAITDRQNAVPAVREVAQVVERPDLLTGGSTLTELVHTRLRAAPTGDRIRGTLLRCGL
jgi:hypothetical protein